MSSPATFPLITLQPATDCNNAWVALLLEAGAPVEHVMLARLLGDFALAEVLDSLACVVHVDPATIDPALAANLPPGRLVLQFPVALAADPACHATLVALREAGFGLMASGFPAAGAVLCPGIDSLAVACPGPAMPAGLGDWLRQLPGPHLALDTPAPGKMGNDCPDSGKFHWLAGHLAGHAAPVAKSDPTSRSLLLKLLALVTSDADSADLEAVIKRDPNLSYHLLKLVNSVAFASSKQITNFSQAIALLGRRQLQRWLQLLLYARPQGSTVASPLLPRAALRASLMEALAKRSRLSREMQDHAFMAGMFSLLEALFGLPLAAIIEPLNLPASVVQALTAGKGPLDGLLAVVVAGEGSPSPALADALAVATLTTADWAVALVEATRWTVQVSKEA